MGPVLTIAGKDLRQRLRDRSAIVLGFIAPVVIAGLMSVAFRGTEKFHFDLVVVDHDHGSIAAAVVQGLTAPDLRDLVTVKRATSDTGAASQVRHGDVGAALVIPAGFTDAATAGNAASLQVLTSIDEQLSGEVARALADSFVAQINADRLSVAEAIRAGASTPVPDLVTRAAKLQLPESVKPASIGSHPLRPISYYAPGMAIFFVLFAVAFGSRSFITERREGTIDRMVAAPIAPTAILAGKAVSVFAYGTVSLATMAIVTSAVFGANWGPAPAVALLCVLMAAAVVSFTALVITLARTERQAETMASIIVFGLALLGGNFVFVSSEPPLMRRLALLTPNGWALRGFTDLATNAGSGAVVEPAIAIAVITVLVGAIAAARARRTVLG